MSATPDAPVDDRAAQQIRLDVDGQQAVARYEIDGEVVTFTHTFVPESLRGRGIASRLVEAGLAMARHDRLKVVPQCPMVAAYMKAHPDTHDLLNDEGRALVAAG